MSASSDDLVFVERVVQCWGIERYFSELAKEITPEPKDANAIGSVEDAMREVAAKVWNRDGFSLSLMGSCLFATDILKQLGQSDRDYALRKIGNDSSVSTQEWNAFFGWLSKDSRFVEVRMGTKAIKFRDVCLNLDWEVVPIQGHFSYDLVTYPTLEGTANTSDRNQMRSQFYAGHPGARNSVKVLKRLCPQLDGNMVEALVCRVGTDNPALADQSGLRLFEHLITLFHNYPWGRPIQPLDLLTQDAAKYGRQQQIEEKLQDARRIASIIKEGTTCQQPCLRMPSWFGNSLMAIMGIFAGIYMTELISQLDSIFPMPTVFAAVVCPDRSCFCSDCRENWRTCRSTKDYDCNFFEIRLNRCNITFCVAVCTLVLHVVLIALAFSALRRLHGKRLKHMRRHQSISVTSLIFVVLVSVMAIGYHFHFWGVGDLRVLSTLASNLTNMLSLAMSGAVFVLVWDAHQAASETWDGVNSLGFSFVVFFVLRVLYEELTRTIEMWSRGTSEGHLANQNHIFYSVTLVLQLGLAFLSWFYAPRNRKDTAATLLCAQVFWQLVDMWYLASVHHWPLLYAKYNLSVIICSRIALAWKLWGIVAVCSPKS